MGVKGIPVLSAKSIDHVSKWGQQGRSIPVGNDDVQWFILEADDMVEGSVKLRK